MVNKLSLGAILATASLALAMMPAQAAKEWYFYVKNNSKTKIVKLQVSETKKEWGDFDIGSGIASGPRSVWSGMRVPKARLASNGYAPSFRMVVTANPAKWISAKTLMNPLSSMIEYRVDGRY